MNQHRIRAGSIGWHVFAGMVFFLALTLLFREEPEPEVAPQAESRIGSAEESLGEEPNAPTQPAPVWRDGDFSGRSFYHQMLDLGVAPDVLHGAVNALTPVYDFRKARPEHRWRLAFLDGTPVQLTLTVSPAEIYDVLDLGGEPKLKPRDILVFRHPEVVRGRLQDNLFQSLAHVPEGHRLAQKLSDVFAWDLDFYKDPRQGDRFEMLVEKVYINTAEGPVFHDYGLILAARYFGSRETFEAYRYQTQPGKQGYFNERGQSLVRSVLRSPLRLRSVSSSFKRRRFHPILKTYRPHNGVDYRADPNTPVRAVASGKVATAGRNGGAGIAVEIQHQGQMLTQYFHLNAIAKGVRRGSSVKQGQVIGYVGKTGLATSYHLHFGMKIRGKYVDPQKQKFEPGTPIPKDQEQRFQNEVAQFRNMLAPESVWVTGQPLVKLPNMFTIASVEARL